MAARWPRGTTGSRSSRRAENRAPRWAGERTTTFTYRDNNAIEYNAGLINGVLEVVAIGYNGTEKHDFWAKNGQNAFKLCNYLPLAKDRHKAPASDQRDP